MLPLQPVEDPVEQPVLRPAIHTRVDAVPCRNRAGPGNARSGNAHSGNAHSGSAGVSSFRDFHSVHTP